MSTIPIFNAVRIIPRDEEFLNRKLGSRGEIFYDRDSNSLRLYNGSVAGGISLAKADLTNVPNSIFLAKATAAGVGSGGNNPESGASISVSATAPQNAESGNLWFNSVNGYLYVYINDGSSEQWVQPSLPIASLATVAFTGDYDDLVNVPEIAEVDLTGLATEDYVDTAVSNIVNAAPETLDTLNELAAALGDDANFATTVSTALGLKAPINNPTFTGTVGGITASMVGLGNVTNESKATMFSSPTFTGTVAGVTATHVGLGNVTNESKATMFTSPTFTGTATLQQTVEVLDTKTGATGTVTHDFSTGAIWYHSSISANFTANFTNVPTTDNRAISIALILIQGATPYIPNVVQIAGTPVTINWQDNTPPTGNANKRDLVSFTLLRVGAAWSVIGSLSTYG